MDERPSASLLSLPNDVFEHLLPYLYIPELLALEATCRRLYRICDMCYWKRLRHLQLVPFIRSKGPFDVTCCQRLVEIVLFPQY